jgi:cytoskeletal protein CcmA (bactofilin family)
MRPQLIGNLIRNDPEQDGEARMEKSWSGWQRKLASRSDADPQTRSSASPKASGERLTTFFDDGCEVNGRLVVRTSIAIDGEFRGAIESDETVTVGPAAAIEGDICARSVQIRGAVVGDVAASREVVIHATGRVHGDVSTPSLVVERGAFFSGRTRMYRPEVVARMNPIHSEVAADPPPQVRAAID